MKTRTPLAIALMLGALPGGAAAGELDWLSGTWCGAHDGVLSEERWMPERGGVLLGMHRDTRGGQALGFEFMRIAQRDGAWTLLAQPQGRAVVEFRASEVREDRVVFANATHDFPRRVIYRRIDADTLHARVDDGSTNGTSMQWTWTRDCNAPAPR